MALTVLYVPNREFVALVEFELFEARMTSELNVFFIAI